MTMIELETASQN